MLVDLFFSISFQFYEELVHAKDSGVKLAELPNKPSNKKIKFSYSDSSGSDDDDDEEDEEEDDKSDTRGDDTASHKDVINQESNPQDAINQESDPHTKDDVNHGNQTEEKDNDNDGDGKNDENQPDNDNNGDGKNHENQPKETEEPPTKKQCVETVATKSVIHAKVEEKSIDKLIEAELEELGDKNKVS